MRYQVYDPRYQVPNTTKSRTTHYKKQLLPVINTCATWTATAFSVFNKVTQAELRVPRSQKIKRAISRKELAVRTFSFFLGTLSNLRESWEPGVWIHTFVIQVLPGGGWGEESKSHCVYCAAWYLSTAVLSVAKRALSSGSSTQTRCAAKQHISRTNDNLSWKKQAHRRLNAWYNARGHDQPQPPNLEWTSDDL